MVPLRLASGFVQALNSLDAGELLTVEVVDFYVVVALVIGDEDFAAGDGWPRVAAGDGSAPEYARASLRKLLDESRFAPHVVALGSHPLGPVVGEAEVGN